MTRVAACGVLLLPAFTNGVAVLTAIRIRVRWREVTAFAIAFLAAVAAMLVLAEALILLGVQSTAASFVSAIVFFPLAMRLASSPIHALGEGRGHVGWVYVGSVTAQEHSRDTPGATALMEALLSRRQVADRWTFLDALAPDPACQDRLLSFYRDLGYEEDPAAAPRRGRRARGVRMQRPPGPSPTVPAAPGG